MNTKDDITNMINGVEIAFVDRFGCTEYHSKLQDSTIKKSVDLDIIRDKVLECIYAYSKIEQNEKQVDDLQQENKQLKEKLEKINEIVLVDQYIGYEDWQKLKGILDS